MCGGLLLGCDPRPATELVVQVSTDYDVEAELRSVRLTARREGVTAAFVDRTFALGASGFVLPGEATLVARDADDPRRVVVRVEGTVGGRPVSQSAVVRFEAERTLYLQLALSRRCLDVTCPEGTTCDRGTCVSATEIVATERRSPADAAVDDVVDAALDRPADPGDLGADAVAPPDLPSFDAASVDVTTVDVTTVDVTPEDVAARDVTGTDVPPDVVPHAPIEQVAAGLSHTCARLADGSVWCWGDNTFGQLGNGTVGAPASFAVRSRAVDSVAIAAGPDFTCSLRTDHAVECWGDNRQNEILRGPTPSYPTPAQSVLAVWGDWTAIALQAGGGCTIGTLRPVRCWPDPTRAEWFVGCGDHTWFADRLFSGGGALCARLDSGLACRGFSNGTALPPANPCGFDSQPLGRARPLRVALHGGTAGHLCAIDASDASTSGPVICVGDNRDGQLGARTPASSTAPLTVAGVGDASDVVAGRGFTCALRATGRVSCWGRNAHGHLGRGDTLAGDGPATVLGATGTAPFDGVTSLVASQSNEASPGRVYALRFDGTLWAWGQDAAGALGDGGISTVSRRARAVVLPAGAPAVSEIHMGAQESFAWLGATGTRALHWGHVTPAAGGTAALTPSPVERSDARPNPVLPGFDRACALQGAAVVCGAERVDLPFVPVAYGVRARVCARSAAGELHCNRCTATECFGASSAGAAVRVATGVTDFALDDRFVCAANATSVTCSGAFSARGDGGSSDGAGAPVALPGGVRRVRAAGGRVCAVTTTGAVWCWGVNRGGDPATSLIVASTAAVQALPSQVTALSGRNVVDVAMGRAHTCALIDDGQVLCWGDDRLGQLGDGDAASRLAPRAVEGLSEVRAIEAGENATCALRASGDVWCWGEHSLGQLGAGAPWRTRPVRVTAL